MAFVGKHFGRDFQISNHLAVDKLSRGLSIQSHL